MVRESKVKLVEKVKDVMSKYPVIGIIDMHKMPSKQLQQIRKGLREKAVIKMTKKTILKYALESMKDEKIKQIENYMPKQPAIIMTDLEPFKLYSMVKNLKFKTFAKNGDIAGEDIWISAGPTSLLAGPAISEFQQAGVPAGIEAGKIAIKKDKLLVKGGAPINDTQANILRKLNIEPIDVTLNIVAVYDREVVYTEDVLGLVLTFPTMVPQAFRNALNLSVSVCYPTKENIKYLLSKAYMEAKAISGLVRDGVEQKEESGEVHTEETKDEAVNEKDGDKEV